MPELSVRREMEKIAGKNQIFQTIFRGAGAYRHYIPAAVKSITSKENFVTAYTPYQAEISQGILQSIFEYQTMICDLTGMDASNASVYDGASAAAEGIAMCRDPETPESSDFTDRFPVRDPDSADLLPWKRDAGGADSGTGRSDGQRSFKKIGSMRKQHAFTSSIQIITEIWRMQRRSERLLMKAGQNM